MDSPSDIDEAAVSAAPPRPTAAELLAVMQASDADVAAGRTVELAPVLAGMRAAAEQVRREREVAEGS